MRTIWKALFWIVARAGRRVGGIPPRRVTIWLARRAYGSEAPDATGYRWIRDRDGLEFLLHPHFINDVEVIAFGSYDPSLQRLLRSLLKPGMVCIDVGANIGLVCLHMAQVTGSTGRVFAFEPVGHLFDSLQKNIQRNHLEKTVDARPVAVSNYSGHAQMNSHEESEPNQGLALLVGDGSDSTGVAEVGCVSLDDFVALERIERLDFIKIDVQGAESLVIEGARSCLDRFGPDVVMEVSSGLSPLGRSPRETLGLMEEMGYEVLEVKAGAIGRPLRASTLPPDFSAPNVLCRKQRSRSGDLHA